MSDELTEAGLIRMLAGALEIKRQRDQYASAYEIAKQPLEDWLLAHPGERLRDGEKGIVAYWQEGGSEKVLDLICMTADAPDAVLELAAVGLLKLDASAFKAQAEKLRAGAVAERYMMTKPRKGHVEVRKEE